VLAGVWLCGTAAMLCVTCYQPDSIDCVVRCGPACPNGMRCSNGMCTAASDECPALEAPAMCEACTHDTLLHSRCLGDAIVRCRTQGWTREEICAGQEPVCYQGSCRQCRPGTWRCRDGCQEPCNISGAWAGFESCTSCTAAAPPAPLLVAGWSHTCALGASGRPKCWGDRGYGQLGLPVADFPGDPDRIGAAAGEIERIPFVDLGRDSIAVMLAAGGRHTCALLRGGAVKCWGDNGHGQLGLGDRENRGDDPLEMGDLLPAIDLGDEGAPTALAAGGQHTCALLDSGQVKCWGDNRFGQLGQGDTRSRGGGPCEMGIDLLPVDLRGARATAIAAGSAHTCARLDTGEVRCWGDNEPGQLGLGDRVNRGGHPGPIETLTLRPDQDIVALAAGFEHTCALDARGRAMCWGRGSAGQLGLETVDDRIRAGEQSDPFVHLDSTVPIVAIAVGSDHTCASLMTGALACWGFNAHGQLGLGDMRNRGERMGDMYDALPAVDLGSSDARPAKATAVAAGGDHTCAILESEEIKCWGLNAHGELGLGDDASRGTEAAHMGNGLLPVQLDLSSGAR